MSVIGCGGISTDKVREEWKSLIPDFAISKVSSLLK